MTAMPMPARTVAAAPAYARPWPARRSARVFSLGAPVREDVPRRVLSFAVASVALLLIAPLWLAIALAIKLSSDGPVFYTQTRVGINRRRRMPRGGRYRTTDLGGKPFRIYKFRTMIPNVPGPDDPKEVWATPHDPRVTRIGRFLRLYRLDELPQLINVLLGDMDVVGPRPEQPTIFQRLREEIDHYQERQRVRPGITGWAQINQQYDSSIDDVKRKLDYDLEYIDRKSVLEDLRIMVRTMPVVVGKQGAW